MPLLQRVKIASGVYLGDSRGKALLSITGGSFLLIGVQMIYPVLLPSLRSTYDFNLTTAGLLLTTLWLANAAGQLPSGLIADRFETRSVLVSSVVITAITLSIIILVESSPALFVGTVLLGFGLALHGVARFTAMDDLYPDRAGTPIGIVLGGADAGQTVLPPVAGFVAAATVWQFGFGFTIPLFIIVAAALWIYVPEGGNQHSNAGESGSAWNIPRLVQEIWSQPMGFVTAILIIYSIILVTFTSFYPTYLIEQKHFSPFTSAVLFGSFFAVGIIIKPIGGVLYNRVGFRSSLLLLAPLSALSLGLIPTVEGIAAMSVLTILVAPILGYSTVAQTHVLHMLTDEMKGTGLGFARACSMTTAAFAPVFFGFIADRGFFDEVFLILAGLIVFLLVIIALSNNIQ